MKHQWYLDKWGKPDQFRLDVDIHNGPQCMRCQRTFCEHCWAPWEDECPSGQLSFFEEDNQ